MLIAGMFHLNLPSNGGVGGRRSIRVLDMKPPLQEGLGIYTLYVSGDTLGIGGQSIQGYTGPERVAVLHLRVENGEVVETKTDPNRSRDMQQKVLRQQRGKEFYP